MTLTIWSDFACPYCYIGETRLDRAIEELGLKNEVTINYKAFELDPNAPKEVVSTTPERFAMKYRLSLKEAEEQIQHISDLGKELGIDFRYATTRYTNTRDAHRLMKLAEAKYDRQTVERLNQALFKAYFVENLELSDHNVLTDKAREAGLDEKEVRDVLSIDKYDDEVRLDEREAAMRGVHGVPYIMFGSAFAVPGAMSVDGFKDALNRLIKREKEEKLKTTERPHACGPDGCKIL